METERGPKNPSIRDIVEGLLIFDEPMLNSRYHGILYHDPVPERRDALAALPGLVVRSHRLARRAAEDWARTRGNRALDERFLREGERFILESFLDLAENQLRLIAFMARSAPTLETREPFDEMADLHREICDQLRETLRGLTTEAHAQKSSARSVQEEDKAGHLRGQVEQAIRSRWASGRGIRRVVLSDVGERHLRDQGCFAEDDTKILGVPVAIDMSWETPVFAIEGYDIVPLEELRVHDR
ncbi:MAG TPA: hypothetical protein VM889_14375 [Candidatus Thermoplasmatota archaeon]|nr:hypothetical protein [Candidatus Thermoplasmatota archaeon]